MSSSSLEKYVNPGGLKDIDPKDPHVVFIGQWAVKEYNRRSGKSLIFLSVSRGWIQVVEGFMYYLELVVDDGPNNPKKYGCKVWEKSWENFLDLLAFEEIYG